MRNLFSTAIIAIFSIVLACTPKANPKITATTPVQPTEPAAWDTMGKPVLGIEGEELPGIVFDFDEPSPVNLDSLAPYNASHTFEVDLIHTRIEISFDWAKKRANGKATLTMRPWFYATDKVTLDAKNFDIQSVTFDGKSEPLKYAYNNEQLTIQLGKTFTRNDEFKVPSPTPPNPMNGIPSAARRPLQATRDSISSMLMERRKTNQAKSGHKAKRKATLSGCLRWTNPTSAAPRKCTSP